MKVKIIFKNKTSIIINECTAIIETQSITSITSYGSGYAIDVHYYSHIQSKVVSELYYLEDINKIYVLKEN